MTDTTREPTEAEVEALRALIAQIGTGSYTHLAAQLACHYEPRDDKQRCSGSGRLFGNSLFKEYMRCPGCTRCQPKVTPQSDKVRDEPFVLGPDASTGYAAAPVPTPRLSPTQEDFAELNLKVMNNAPDRTNAILTQLGIVATQIRDLLVELRGKGKA